MNHLLNMAKDYYKILGIEKGASQDEIKKAFRTLAHKHHPDKDGGDEAKFKEANEAYQVLSDEKKRAQYDQFGQTFDGAGPGFGGFGGGGGFQGGNINFEDLQSMFGDMFGFGGGGGRRREARRGGDIKVTMHITFHDAAFGTERTVELFKPTDCAECSGSGVAQGSKMASCGDCGGQGQVRKTQRTVLGNFATVVTCHACEGVGNVPEERCKDCGGAGVKKEMKSMTVKVPAGINHGETLRIRGAGEAAGRGAMPGDLYVKVVIDKDDRFMRDGFDMRSILTIGFSEAALGTQKPVETLDGEVTVKVPDGIQSGAEIRLKGRGVTRLGRSDRGDHYVKVIVETPKKLSRKAKRLLKELGEEGV